MLRAVLMAALLVAGHAQAQELDRIDFEATATTADDFRAQAGRVRASLGDGARHASATADERARIEALLARIEQRFVARGSSASFSEGDRLDVFNAQEEVNAILARNDGNRLVCEFITRTGSHRRSKECLSVREREARRAAQHEALREIGRDRSLRGDGS